MKIAFFGTDEFSLTVHEELVQGGYAPELIVTAPAQKSGRGQELHEPPLYEAARAHNIACIQPASLKELAPELGEKEWDLFIVASYGKIIPSAVLKLPRHGALNVHPSLLPQHRGPSPIESCILAGDTETGVSIMVVDAEMDHGPIVAQEHYPLTGNEYYPDLAQTLSEHGAELLVRVIPEWIAGSIKAEEQDHAQASYTKKITIEDGLIDVRGDALTNYRKVRAFLPWPKAYYFHKHSKGEIRVAITRAHLDEQKNFVIDKVIPAGKKEMPYKDFLRGVR